MKAPQRGEVWLVDLGMAAKVRPALVISVPAADADRRWLHSYPTPQVHAVLGSKRPCRSPFCERGYSSPFDVIRRKYLDQLATVTGRNVVLYAA